MATKTMQTAKDNLVQQSRKRARTEALHYEASKQRCYNSHNVDITSIISEINKQTYTNKALRMRGGIPQGQKYHCKFFVKFMKVGDCEDEEVEENGEEKEVALDDLEWCEPMPLSELQVMQYGDLRHDVHNTVRKILFESYHRLLGYSSPKEAKSLKIHMLTEYTVDKGVYNFITNNNDMIERRSNVPKRWQNGLLKKFRDVEPHLKLFMKETIVCADIAAYKRPDTAAEPLSSQDDSSASAPSSPSEEADVEVEVEMEETVPIECASSQGAAEHGVRDGE